MYFRGVFVVLLIAMIASSGSGCASKATFGVWRPAGLDVNGVERIVVLDFEGPGDSGKIVRSALTSQLWENHFYTLVDQGELQRVRPIFLPNGAPDVGAAVEASRQMGIDAVLTGQVVSYNVIDDKTTQITFSAGKEEKKNKDGSSSSGSGATASATETYSREASVSIAFKLIDVQTGAIRAAHQVSHNFNGESISNPARLPGRERVLAELTNKCAREVEFMLAPHFAPNEVILARQYYGRGTSELRRGNGLAKQQKWSEAEAAWESALKQGHKNHAAMYSLALAAEARGDYPTAMRRVEQAINEYGDPKYHSFRKKLEANRESYQLAMNQLQAKNQLVAARQGPGRAMPVNFNQSPNGLVPGGVPAHFVSQPNSMPGTPPPTEPMFAPQANPVPSHLPPPPFDTPMPPAGGYDTGLPPPPRN